MTKILALFATTLLAGAACMAQTPATSTKNTKEAPATATQVYRSSPAYAELLLRRTEATSSLESLLLEFTEEYPKVIELRHALSLIERESDRLAKVKASESSKLTLALGKLIVRKIELETEFWKLQKTYKDEHPDVKKAKRQVEVFESAISEVLN